MMRLDSGGTPHLVVLAPDSDRGRRIPLDRDYLVVGREQTCDVWFDDPHVSRTHAALQRRGNRVYVEDLGSSGGTFVNGAATAARELRAGDVLTFASVSARLESGATVADETSALPVPPAEAAVVHQIDEQRAGVINNVDRDQYISHVQYVNQQRENFLREVAATKTKARWLAWTGFVTFGVGFGLFAYADLSFIKEINNARVIAVTEDNRHASYEGRNQLHLQPGDMEQWSQAHDPAVVVQLGESRMTCARLMTLRPSACGRSR